LGKGDGVIIFSPSVTFSRPNPDLYMLLRRTVADAGLSTYTAQNQYQRKQLFVVNKQPGCTPEIKSELKTDGELALATPGRKPKNSE